MNPVTALQKFFFKLSVFFQHWNDFGTRVVLRRYFGAIAHILGVNQQSQKAGAATSTAVSMIAERDLDVLLQAHPIAKQDSNNSNWVWATPPFGKGSGGHHDIFMLARKSAELGQSSLIGLTDGDNVVDTKVSSEVAAKYYGYEDLDFKRLADLEEQGAELVIATGWQTFAPATRIPAAKRAYLVQDFEPWFFPAGTHAYLAEQTYKFGVPCLTAGPWLANLMRNKYGATAGYFELGYSPDIYSLNENSNVRNKIVVYYRSVTPRRSSDLLLEVIHRAAHRLQDFEIHFVGGKPENLPKGNVVVHGSLNHHQLADLYRSAAVTAVFSMTNTSLVPVEALAAGSSVLSNLSEPNALNLKGTNAGLVELDVSKMADALVSLASKMDGKCSADNAKSVVGREWDIQCSSAINFLESL